MDSQQVHVGKGCGPRIKVAVNIGALVGPNSSQNHVSHQSTLNATLAGLHFVIWFDWFNALVTCYFQIDPKRCTPRGPGAKGGQGGGPRGGGPKSTACKIFIGGIGQASESDIKEALAQYGTVSSTRNYMYILKSPVYRSVWSQVRGGGRETCHWSAKMGKYSCLLGSFFPL